MAVGIRSSVKGTYRFTSLEKPVDTPLLKERRRREKVEATVPNTWQDSNPRPPDYEACAPLLCYNHGPIGLSYKLDLHVVNFREIKLAHNKLFSANGVQSPPETS